MGSSSFSYPASLFSLPATIVTDQAQLPISALMDSRAEQNLISSDSVEQLQLSTIPLDTFRSIASITGQPLTQISHRVSGVHVTVSCNHHKFGEFLIFDSSAPHFIASPGLFPIIQFLTGQKDKQIVGVKLDMTYKLRWLRPCGSSLQAVQTSNKQTQM